MLENRNFTIKSIAKDIFYSESYIYKLISKIKILFSSLNLNIFLNKSVDNYILTGDELSIRYVHYFSIIRGNNFLSNETITSEVTDSFFHNHNSTIQSLSPAETARINCYSNIFSISINNHKYIHKL
ncbi:helix-turn-helix domain-containing protein, partial [Lactococcus garvieae]|uniref:helix-turn-helix domain-containing protein n=1 Tax=Lactococcus garvieae TaxID=1363 RepID=UPI003D6E9610